MAKINIEFDGKIYSVDESTLAPLASPLEKVLIQQFAGTGVVIRLGGTDYNVDANKLASARNVLTDHFGSVAGSDSKVTVNGVEYGLSKTKLQGATDKMNETLEGMSIIHVDPEEPDAPPEPVLPASEGLEYELNEDGVSYSLVRRGTCTDTDIVIPAMYQGLPVTNVDGYTTYYEQKGTVYPRSVGCFQDCADITSVIIPNSVTSIGYQAFCNCTSLSTITIPDSVTNIDSGAFDGCSSLTSVTIPDSVTSIGSSAFANCNSLTNINIPDGITSIGDYVFSGSNNSNLNININDIANLCSLTFGYYGGIFRSGGNLCINGKLVTNLEIPEGVTEIKDYVFAGCTSLLGVTIPNSVTNIGQSAFCDCYNLTSITIPNSVTSIGGAAFQGCSRLTSVTIPNSITVVEGNTFEYCRSLTQVTIPDGVTTIKGRAFNSCKGLTNVTIPNSVTSIDAYAFGGCDILTSITFNGTVGEWSAISKPSNWYSGTPLTHIQCTDGQITL